jgi:hypothetical protein
MISFCFVLLVYGNDLFFLCIHTPIQMDGLKFPKIPNAFLSDVHACNVFSSMVPKSCFLPNMKTCCLEALYAIFV